MANIFGRVRHLTALLLVLYFSHSLTKVSLAASLPRPLSLRPSNSLRTEQQLEEPNRRDRDSLPPWFAPASSASLPWWQRSWEAWQRWRQAPPFSSGKLKQIIVTPVLPDGTTASPASLWLPHDQLKHERGLHRIETQGVEGSLLEKTRSTGRSSRFFNLVDTPMTSSTVPVPWYTYNSSEATPLVPSTLSWMSDTSKMSFRAGKGSLDIDVARGLSRLVAIAYCNGTNLPAWNCTRCKADFTPKRVIVDPLWDLQSFVGWSDRLNAIVIAFRGTDSHSYYNWVENMRTWRTDLALSYKGIPPHALVHGGFFYSYNSSYLAANITAAVKDIVLEKIAHEKGADGGGKGGFWTDSSSLEKVEYRSSGRKTNNNNSSSSRKRSSSLEYNNNNNGYGGNGVEAQREIDDEERIRKKLASGSAPTVFVTGHSLGGALATLAALDLRVSLGLPDVRVVSFGSPRVGNYIFSKWFEKEIGPHWRFTHNRDIVPSVPPGYMGFHHVSQEVWVVDVLSHRTLVGICDGSGEDPKCHNSVCHLGLCSSVADHLLYLSEMYSPHPYGC